MQPQLYYRIFVNNNKPYHFIDVSYIDVFMILRRLQSYSASLLRFALAGGLEHLIIIKYFFALGKPVFSKLFVSLKALAKAILRFSLSWLLIGHLNNKAS